MKLIFRGNIMNFRFGKPIDILSLQQKTIKDFKSHVEYIKTMRTKIFQSPKLIKRQKCPICGSTKKGHRLNIYGGQYYQCLSCSHCFVFNIPTEGMITDFYSTNSSYSSTYTDKKLLDKRVKQIAVPKVEWIIKQFKSNFGRTPSKILDVGAGGGHFVHACRLCNIDAQGIEISESSRNFCKKNFDIDLEKCDFLKSWKNFVDADVVAFWGVLEHTPSPLSLLKAAHKLLDGRDALVVAEVPHWNSFSTIIQTIFPDNVARHLDPFIHIHCFTFDSLKTAFERSGFTPLSAWYFGMDAYELFIQLSNLLNNELFTDNLGSTFPILQNKIDRAGLSEELVFAGKPVKSKHAD